VNPETTDLERATSAKEQHLRAVSRVISAMRERLAEPLTLHELARIAYLSPFHFNRVFRLVTGIPPGRFLAALRMSEAKRLLLESHMSVTDICISVGYSSLGTFTTQFTTQVGAGPREFRRLGAVYGDLAVAEMLQAQPSTDGDASGRVAGHIYISKPDMLIMIGLFPSFLALGRPVACTSTYGPGFFQLAGVPDGTYRLLAAAHSPEATVSDVLVADCRPGQWVGATNAPITVQRGQAAGQVRLTLAPAADTAPPIITGIPLLPRTSPQRTYGAT
jgi:AraC family transcriptional regulator